MNVHRPDMKIDAIWKKREAGILGVQIVMLGWVRGKKIDPAATTATTRANGMLTKLGNGKATATTRATGMLTKLGNGKAAAVGNTVVLLIIGATCRLATAHIRIPSSLNKPKS